MRTRGRATDVTLSVSVVLICWGLPVLSPTVLGLTEREYPWNATCPSKCQCHIAESEHLDLSLDQDEAVRTVDCSGRKLRIIPPDVPQSTQVLRLRKNAIKSLDDINPSLSSLQELDLSHNSIASLSHAIQNLTHLRRLNLAANHLYLLTSDTTQGRLPYLEEYILHDNQIETIEDMAFAGMASLKVLDLSHNKLVQIKDKAFQNVTSLEELVLNGNALLNIEDEAFKDLHSLTRLSLSQNRLRSLNKFTFVGLEDLNLLDLSHNQLTTVPTSALATFSNLKTLILNDNPIQIFSSWDFQDLSIREMNINCMPELIIVDSAAFLNLPLLEVLKMYDNPRLSYIDPEAFTDLPNLRELYLHSNHLPALSVEVIYALPKLEVLSLHDNPLHCDCNVRWLQEAVAQQVSEDVPKPVNASTANSTGISSLLQADSNRLFNLTLEHASRFACSMPQTMSTMYIAEIPLGQIPPVCAPTVLPIFNDTHQVEINTYSLTYNCRAIGIPTPYIHWILSNGKVINGTSNFSRIRFDRKGTLTIEHIKASDAGNYRCVATNSQGSNTVITTLKVHSKDIRILNKSSATNFVTVTWNGTQSTIGTSDYLVLYRRQGSTGEYGKIHLRPYMRGYTIENLLPETTYEFCIAYQHDGDIVKLNCRNITTKDKGFMLRGIKTSGTLTVLIALCVTCSSVILLCILMAVVRRYKRRKPYSEPPGFAETDSAAGAGHSHGERQKINYHVRSLSQIPLDNLYSPPSTSLCTSQTSLISQSNA